MAEIPKTSCEIGLGEPRFDGSMILKMASNVVLDMESLVLFDDKNRELTSSPISTRSFSRKGSYRGEKKIFEREVSETSNKALSSSASSKGSSLHSMPEKCVIVPVATTELLNSGESNNKCKRYNKRTAWAGSRRILFIFATLSSMGTMLLIYLTLAIGKINGDVQAQ